MTGLFLMRLPLDQRRFREWALGRGLGARGFLDEGAALHVLLSGLFGKGALQPFRLFAPQGQRIASLYGYAQSDPAGLLETARLSGDPDALPVLDLAGASHKPMPLESLLPGKRLGYDLRLMPVRRRLSEKEPHPGKDKKPVLERDAFQIAYDQATAKGGPKPDRQQVYADWLADRLKGVAKLESCRLAAFQRAFIWRGGAAHEAPDAVLHGSLTIIDDPAFIGLLAGGVGRHKAYGYGMMLLRPPDSAPLHR